jgi:exo-beta-1,3-glucanase (GH17 family)
MFKRVTLLLILAMIVVSCGDSSKPTATPEPTATPTETPIPLFIEITCPRHNEPVALYEASPTWRYTLLGMVTPSELPPGKSISLLYQRTDAEPTWYFVYGNGVRPDSSGQWVLTGYLGNSTFPPEADEMIQVVVMVTDDSDGQVNDQEGFAGPSSVDFADAQTPPVFIHVPDGDEVGVDCVDEIGGPAEAESTGTLGRATTRALTDTCWISYGPTNQDPTAEPIVIPSEDSIRQDLQVLHDTGFTGLITYSAYNNQHILAEEVGFDWIIIGVSDPTSPDEINLAIQAAEESDIVLGYSVGNEGLQAQNYTVAELRSAITRIRDATDLPVTTTEDSRHYTGTLFSIGDWVFPNVHPYHNGILNAEEGVTFTVEQYNDFLSKSGGRVVLFKEVGYPTAGVPDVSEELQADYYRQLSGTEVVFAYFEAFDQPWKTWDDAQPYWGLFDSERNPKPVVSEVCEP